MNIAIKKNLPTPAQAYWNQRQILSQNREHILALTQAVNRSLDLHPYQWAHLIAFALEFAPDIILELGRNQGNSTCAFTQVANWLHPHRCRVLSLCRSDYWQKDTLPRIRQIVPDSWFQPLQAVQTNILTFDFQTALADFHKILVFWDAHGYEVAECVLGNLLPCIFERPHIVIMHDLSDARYSPPSCAQYDNHRLWKGNNNEGLRVRLGHIDSAVEQAVAIVDFTTRNKLLLHSADHSLHTELHPEEHVVELQNCLGKELFSLNAHWFWFSLNQGTGMYTFPKYCPPQASELSEELLKKRRIPLIRRVKVALKILLNRYPVEKIF